MTALFRETPQPRSAMARQEQDREDLLRDATALAPRGRFSLAGFEEDVVIGFRGSAASVYFGADPALHFNQEGELRRGFVGDRLIKARQGRLVQMHRVRVPGEVQLRSRTLSEAEQSGLLDELHRLLRSLESRLSSGEFQLVGEAPEPGQASPRAIQFLRSVLQQPLQIAQTPNVDPGAAKQDAS